MQRVIVSNPLIIASSSIKSKLMNYQEKKIVGLVIVGIAVIFGWNYFLIQRDNKLFDAVYNQKEKICAQVKSFHPDCHLE